jgi:FtsZ-binding cell division protein ZapB
MPINQVTGISPQLLIKALQQKFEFQGFPNLQIGDKLEAQVAQKLGENKVLVMMKGARVAADTTVPLQVGQKINVQVESLQPQIVLRLITSDAAGEQGKITGYLKAFRRDPQAFTELFRAGGTLLSAENLKTLSNTLLRSQSQSLGQLIHTLIFSTDTMENPFFVRDFVARSGLLLERTLGKALQEDAAGAVKAQPAGNNLKSALIRFGAEIRGWLGANPDIPEAELTKLLRLAEYSDRSVHALETHQVLNVVSRDQENRFMVQIPFAFPQSLTMQDIFIEFDGSRGEKKDGDSPFRVVFFLNLDALGEMMIDVGIRGQELTAELSCQSVDTVTVLSSNLEELRENLNSLGFRVVRMTCDVRDDIGPTKNDYVKNASWYEGDVINFFA